MSEFVKIVQDRFRDSRRSLLCHWVSAVASRLNDALLSEKMAFNKVIITLSVD